MRPCGAHCATIYSIRERSTTTSMCRRSLHPWKALTKIYTHSIDFQRRREITRITFNIEKMIGDNIFCQRKINQRNWKEKKNLPIYSYPYKKKNLIFSINSLFYYKIRKKIILLYYRFRRKKKQSLIFKINFAEKKKQIGKICYFKKIYVFLNIYINSPGIICV